MWKTEDSSAISPTSGRTRRFCNWPCGFTSPSAQRRRKSALSAESHAHAGTRREKRVAAYIGAGDQRWPAVHREDAARLYRLAVENAPAGMLLRATAEAGIPQREIAATIGEGLGLPTVSVSAADAPAHFGWMESVVRLDNVALSVDTQRLLGWTPRCAGLIEDMRAHYFTE
jgi:nucleoside-diphosphate-sugar epimerase